MPALSPSRPDRTADDVKADLIEAFRRAPGTAVHSPSRGRLLVAWVGGQAAWDMVSATYWCLGQDRAPEHRHRRVCLLTWARVMSQHVAGGAETPLREMCRQRSWGWATFMRTVNESSERVARCLSTLDRVGLDIHDLISSEPVRAPAAADV